MRSNRFYGLGLSISVVLAGISLVSLASAQATPAAKSAHAELLKTLRQAHKLLVEADHDYDGHRAKAAEEVHKAIKELEGKHHAKKIPLAATTVNGAVVPVKKAQEAKIHEAQVSSDDQLKQALQLLQGAAPEVNNKHPKATTNVNNAIAEINTALKLK